MNHLEQHGVAEVPSSLYTGATEILSPTRSLVNVFGSRGPWEPGWYLIGQPAGRNAMPLAGPFDSRDEAYLAWERSERAFFAREIRIHGIERPQAGRFGFVADSSIIFEPTVILRPENLVMGKRSRVDAFCKLECGDGLFLGDFVHIASFCHLGIGGGTVVFEEGSSAGSGSKVLSGSASFDGPSWSATHPDVVNKKTVTRIRKNATLLVNSVVLPGCDIGEGATIAAGAVVLGGTTVPAGEVWGGVPARKLVRAGRKS